MIQDYAVIRESATIAAQAAGSAVDGLNAGRIQGEETFTDRMIGAIEERFRDLRVKGVSWTALTLRAHVRNSQETRYGADLMGVLDIHLPDYRMQKGFLAQAKLVEPGDSFDTAEWSRLQTQCGRMLAHSPASFVFLYSRAGIFVVPALSVLALTQRGNPHVLYKRSVQRFFEEHFECFIGDRAISVPTSETLDALVETANARRALLLKAVG
ncbi:MAG: hypothetical protein KF774_21570 [Planctomyces sp.]|nr:hypothetical protein [Planctomyces sp.]